MHNDASLFEIWQNIPLLHWFERLHRNFFRIHLQALLTIDKLAKVIKVQNYTIANYDSGLSSLTARTIRQRNVIVYNHGSLGYVKETKEWKQKNKYSEKVGQVSSESFWKLVNELPENLKDDKWVEYGISIIAVPFCAILHSNDAR